MTPSQTSILSSILTLITLILFPSIAHGSSNNTTLRLATWHQGPVIGPNHPDVINSKNNSGFETGQVVKIDSVYHLFVNEMFERAHRDLRISYWISDDAVNWKRKSTIVESIPGRNQDNPRSEVWVTGVVFNDEEDAWNIFYVAYRGGDASKGEIPGSDYAGRIWRAMSVQKGQNGIAGPYADMGIVLEPDSNSQAWEGQQAVACFNPYQVGNGWYSMYDGHNYLPKGGWPTGMASAPKLKGPWTRLPEGHNPLKVAEEFMENEIVTRLKDGRYLMIFDSFGDYEIGYSLSEDGINWCPEKRVKIQNEANLWAVPGDHYTRTPLCSIENADGSLLVIYTAMTKVNDKNFYAVGQCTLSWK